MLKVQPEGSESLVQRASDHAGNDFPGRLTSGESLHEPLAGSEMAFVKMVFSSLMPDSSRCALIRRLRLPGAVARVEREPRPTQRRLFHSQNCIGYSARDVPEIRMYVPYQTLAVMLLVGLVAGWTATKVVTKHGMGFAGDVIVGVIGAFIGDWLLPRLGVHLGAGLALTVFNATVGAIALLILVRVIRAV
jgi:uncharacterized membrane protein YeaQ/YmgE (transglycosylase-associated protein family)